MSHPNNGQTAVLNDPPEAVGATGDDCKERPAGEDVESLRQENSTLRAKVDELEQMLAMASQVAEDRWVELQREYETLIEEKSEMIRSLHYKNAELRDKAAGHATVQRAPNNAVGAMEPVHAEAPERHELVKMQHEVKEQQKQMKEDEESMMAQMRQMEMALARDRAELARQRAELQRLHGELKRELDIASKDGGLRERLGALQRGVNNAAVTRSGASEDTPVKQVAKPSTSGSPSINKSGLFRRIFGAGQ
jgi:hypothetical protein